MLLRSHHRSSIRRQKKLVPLIIPSLAVEQTAVVEVEHWLLRKLASDQLARQGLIETLNAR
jgi:hypothetical protein